jgi:hypothetical protein
MRLMLPFALAAIFVLAGVILDSNYQRSTPYPTFVQGTVIGFERPHPKQRYPIFEFKDTDGISRRVVNSSQQAIVRLATGYHSDRLLTVGPAASEDRHVLV